MAIDRLEIRLDAEHRRKLTEIATREGAALSETVRRLIDQAYEEGFRARRREAAETIGRLAIEQVPDPDQLSRQLNETYDIGKLY
jgi:hypothetical protein